MSSVILLFCESDVEWVVGAVVEHELAAVDFLIELCSGEDAAGAFEEGNRNFLIGVDVGYRVFGIMDAGAEEGVEVALEGVKEKCAGVDTVWTFERIFRWSDLGSDFEWWDVLKHGFLNPGGFVFGI